MFEVGDIVQTLSAVHGRDATAYGVYGHGSVAVPLNTNGTVTRVGTKKFLVRFENAYPAWFVMNEAYFRKVDQDSSLLEKAAKKAKQRKLGQTPEGMIDIDDPRIDWIWRDAAKIATNNGYCGYYDTIVERLGAPGRERDISVDVKVNGVNIRATVKARSEKEAKALLKEKLNV